MNITLAQIVEIAAHALEAEDRFVRLAKSVNVEAYGASRSGILHLVDERYYQFVVARAMFAVPRLRVALEYQTNDLVLLKSNGERCVTIEMKRWMSQNGERELPGIRADIRKLESINEGMRVMMLFSTCPLGTASEQLQFLQDSLGVENRGWHHEFFEARDSRDEKCAFFVAGLAV